MREKPRTKNGRVVFQKRAVSDGLIFALYIAKRNGLKLACVKRAPTYGEGD